MLQPVISDPQEKSLPLGDKGQIVDDVSDFGIPGESLLLLGELHKGHKPTEQINLGHHCHEYLNGYIELGLNEDPYTLIVLLHPGTDPNPVGLASEVPVLAVDHRLVVVDQVLLGHDFVEDGQLAGVARWAGFIVLQ
jgi:hypothetical protein